MEQDRNLSLGTLLFGLIFMLLVLSRFASLGEYPLSNVEATHALTALSETSSASLFWPPASETAPLSASYNTATVLLFELLGDTNATARAIAAVAGIIFVLGFFVIKEKIRSALLLILGGLFVVSPILLTTSRRAGGTTLALLGLTCFFVLMLDDRGREISSRRIKWAAACLGLSLVSGPGIFIGLTGVAIAYLLSKISRKWSWGEVFAPDWLSELRGNLWLTVLTMILVATGLGLILGGFQGFSESLEAWLHGWTTGAGYSIGKFLLMLVLYEPLIIVFGLAGAVRAIRNNESLGKAVSFWAMGAFLAGVIYPGRNPTTLVWIIIPLGLLSAQMLLHLIERVADQKTWLDFLGLMMVFLVIFGISYLFFRGFEAGVGPTFATLNPQISVMISLSVLAIAGLIFVLFGLGWSWQLAVNTGGVVLALVLFFLTLSSSWRLNFSPWAATAQLLWNAEAATVSHELAVDTLETISMREGGMRRSLPLEFLSPVNPALAWALRDFPVYERDALGEHQSPPAVFARDNVEVVVGGAEYIGQTFNLIERTDWEGKFPPDPISWWFRRDAPVQAETWLLLIRDDLASTGDFNQMLLPESR